MPESKPQEQTSTDEQINKHLRTITDLEVERDFAVKVGNDALKEVIENAADQTHKKLSTLFGTLRNPNGQVKEKLDPNGDEGRYEDTDPVI